jgi:hypothetical protein
VAMARRAVGSDVNRVTSFSVYGHNRPQRDTQSPTKWEQHAVLPDKYVALNTSLTSQTTSVWGFNGSTLLFEYRGAELSFIKHAPTALESQRQRLAITLMAWFALPMPDVTERFAFAGRTSYQDISAVRLNLMNSPVLLRSLWLDAATCVPLAVTYEHHPNAMSAPDPDASEPGLIRGEEVWLDRRREGRFLVPFRMLRLRPTEDAPVSDWRVDRFTINGSVDLTLFQRPKRWME